MQNVKTLISNLKSKVSKNVLITVMIIGILCSLNIYFYQSMSIKIDELNQTIRDRTVAAEQLKEENNALTQQNFEMREKLIDTLQQIDTLNEQIANTNYVPSNKDISSPMYVNHDDGIIMEATCYSGLEVGNNYTADGTYCANLSFDARFVASNDFPLGSRLLILCDSYPDINGEYTVRDRMAYSGVIDIWFGCDASYKEMMTFGRRMITVVYLG